MSGSASASATMQLRMSPTAGIPSSLAELARRAAVIGHRDDRGQVARVLLEAAQERREARAAADRHDPRAAGEEALLVDDLDERLVRVGRAQRFHDRPDRLDRAEPEQPDADDAEEDPAGGVAQGLEGQPVETPWSDPGSASRYSWRSANAPPRARQQLADEHDEQPALEAHARAGASAGGS